PHQRMPGDPALLSQHQMAGENGRLCRHIGSRMKAGARDCREMRLPLPMLGGVDIGLDTVPGQELQARFVLDVFRRLVAIHNLVPTTAPTLPLAGRASKAWRISA